MFYHMWLKTPAMQSPNLICVLKAPDSGTAITFINRFMDGEDCSIKAIESPTIESLGIALAKHNHLDAMNGLITMAVEGVMCAETELDPSTLLALIGAKGNTISRDDIRMICACYTSITLDKNIFN